MKKMGVLQNDATLLAFMELATSFGCKAVIDRPRAISNCPYKFYCRKYVFCNTPIVLDIVFSDDFRGAFQNQPGDPAFLSLNGDI